MNKLQPESTDSEQIHDSKHHQNSAGDGQKIPYIADDDREATPPNQVRKETKHTELLEDDTVEDEPRLF